MARRRISAKPDEVIVTTGSQQAFDLILRVLIDPGDTVLVEADVHHRVAGVAPCAREGCQVGPTARAWM